MFECHEETCLTYFMEFFEAVQKRRSIRRFTKEKVEPTFVESVPIDTIDITE